MGLNVYQPSCIWLFLSVLHNYGKILTQWLKLFWEPRTSPAKDQEWYVPLGLNSCVQLFPETVFPTRWKSRLPLSEVVMQRGQEGDGQFRQQAEILESRIHLSYFRYSQSLRDPESTLCLVKWTNMTIATNTSIAFPGCSQEHSCSSWVFNSKFDSLTLRKLIIS